MRLHAATTNRARHKRRAGYTLVEVVISGMIGGAVMGMLGLTMLTAAKEQRQAFVQAALEADANLTVDRVAGVLRSMSATASVIFADPVPGSPGCYRQVIIAQGEPRSYPRETLIYSPGTGTLTHDPDRNQSGDERPLFSSSTLAVLREFYFYPSFAADGSSDSTTLNVFLLMDEDGAAGRMNPDGTPKRLAVSRSFAIKMRNK
jgi:hypothetical protein